MAHNIIMSKMYFEENSHGFQFQKRKTRGGFTVNQFLSVSKTRKIVLHKTCNR
jgi:hypothetical protein